MILITTMLRVRNESLIIKDTLDHVLSFSDNVLIYDDYSTDSTLEVINSLRNPKIRIMNSDTWMQSGRQHEETRHRAELYREAIKHSSDWFIYMDADERFDFKVKEFLADIPKKYMGVKFNLFDSYLTLDNSAAYESGKLTELNRKFGPEYRRILVAWRNSPFFQFHGSDQREPIYPLTFKVLNSDFRILHFGKSISIESWEKKCDYYSNYFPEPYKSKWLARRGHAIHKTSDFGRNLVLWADIVNIETVDITPKENLKSYLYKCFLLMRYLAKNLFANNVGY